MNEVEARLQAKGCLQCYWMVTLDNPEAGKDYEQRGWYEMDTVRRYGKTCDDNSIRNSDSL